MRNDQCKTFLILLFDKAHTFEHTKWLFSVRLYFNHTFGWPLFEYQSPISYEDIVLSGGFPDPPLHPLVYSKLKERALRCFIRDHKRHFHDRILLAAGARRQESRRRMSTAQDMRLENTRIWANPLIAWSKTDILDYLEIYELPHNPVVDTLHMSGECLCGCFAQADELSTLEIWYPETAAYIYWLQDRVKERGFPWGWKCECSLWQCSLTLNLVVMVTIENSN